MKYRLFTLLLFVTFHTNGQTFSIRPGQIFYHSKTITPVLNQIDRFDNEDYFSFHFDYWTYQKKLLLGFSFSWFDAWTDFSVKENPSFGFGSSSATVYRFALKTGYNIFHQSKRLSLSLVPRLIFERTNTREEDYTITDRAYVSAQTSDLYRGPVRLLSYDSFQILPALGIDLDWNFWWRLHFVYSTYYAWGHKPFQNYYFEYTYDGVPQPTAEWYSDGTGWFFSVGLGMTMFGYQKEKAERLAKEKWNRRKRKWRR